MSKAMDNLITYLTAKKASIRMVITFSDTLLMKFNITNKPLFFFPFHIYFGLSFIIYALWYSTTVLFVIIISAVFKLPVLKTIEISDISLIIFSISVANSMVNYFMIIRLKIPNWHELEHGNIDDYLPKPKLV